jgi:hypothetical protein
MNLRNVAGTFQCNACSSNNVAEMNETQQVEIEFCCLQKGRPEPNAAQAQALTSDAYTEMSADKYNPAVQDFVSKLPGVNTKNIRRILNNVDDLGHLISMSKVRLLVNIITTNRL